MSDTKVHIVTNESEEDAIAHAIDELGAVPKAEVRELVSDMREVQGIANHKGNDEKEAAFKECADALEELL